MATVSDLQQLYIGYFGRAADQAGLNFWLGAINNDGLSLANVHAAFVNSEEYNAQYDNLTVSQKVAAVYQNVLGRAADTAGQDFWTKAIQDGTITEDQLIEGLLSGLSTKDAQAISNKIVVANYYTSAKGDAYVDASKAESAAIIKLVTEKVQSVGTALAEVGKAVGVSNAELATALNTFESAEKAQLEVAKAFLVAKGTDIKEMNDAAILAEIGTGDTNQIAVAATTALGSVQTAAGATGVNAGVSFDSKDAPAVVASKVKLAQDKATADVSAARAEVAKTSGLPQSVDTFNAQAKAYNDAVAAQTAAVNEQKAELAKFNVVNGETAPTTLDVKDDGQVDGVIVASNTGALSIAPAYATANTVQGEPNAKLNAANALLDDVKAKLAADAKVKSAKDAVDATGEKIGNYDEEAVAITSGPAAQLITAVEKQAALTKAVEAYNKAAAPAADFKAASEAVTAAKTAIESEATGLGYKVVDLASGAAGDAAGTVKEVFNFDADVTGNLALTVGKGDVLYVGSNYKLGAAEKYSDVGTNKIDGGDNNALEVFFIQKSATQVDVVIEKAVFGSSSAGAADVATITLTGSNSIDKMSFDAQTGLITFDQAVA